MTQTQAALAAILANTCRRDGAILREAAEGLEISRGCPATANLFTALYPHLHNSL